MGVQEFTIVVLGKTQDEALALMDSTTMDFLGVLDPGDDVVWECVDEWLMPNTEWVPGVGFTGRIRGYRSFRKFIYRSEEQGGEIVNQTPEEPKAPPAPDDAEDAPENPQTQTPPQAPESPPQAPGTPAPGETPAEERDQQ